LKADLASRSLQEMKFVPILHTKIAARNYFIADYASLREDDAQEFFG
jgi:hypothetical protein